MYQLFLQLKLCNKQETGPQVPTDITRMLKYGTNIIQAAGYFNGMIPFPPIVQLLSCLYFCTSAYY
jgi:hypothetical protein